MPPIATQEPQPSAHPVHAWRLHQLEAAGYPHEEALVLSQREDVDLHLAVRLVGSGCPVETAMRILV